MGIKKFNVLILFRLACHEGDEVGHCSEEEDAGEDGSLDRQEEGGAQTAGIVGFLSLQRLRSLSHRHVFDCYRCQLRIWTQDCRHRRKPGDALGSLLRLQL